MEKGKKRRYASYGQEQLDAAVALVRSGKASQRAAAKEFGIPQATISDHLRGRVKQGRVNHQSS
jgi:DNA-binding MarR family transcriptional regulator